MGGVGLAVGMGIYEVNGRMLGVQFMMIQYCNARVYCDPMHALHCRDYGAEERARIGIKDNLVRFSVGIEDPADIIADVLSALDNI